jgi:hypothetical protein
MRQFRRLQRITMRTAAQNRCPADFMRRILAAHATSPFPIGYSHAMIGHDPRCKFLRGGTCDCDITLNLPDRQLVTVGVDGRVRKETRR